jgi:hypothetical protein
MLAEIYGWFTEGFDTADLPKRCWTNSAIADSVCRPPCAMRLPTPRVLDNTLASLK